jgi:hypothetical protein
MIAYSSIHARIENLGTMTEVAEVAKAAAKFDYRMVLYRDEEGRRVADLVRDETEWMSLDIARLVYLEALASKPIRRRGAGWHPVEA